MHWRQWETPPKYFRPNDRWECGRLRSGQPCACGPDAQGRCRENSSLHSSPNAAESSPPCKPRRALWWRRRRLARAVGVLVAGLLTLIFLMGGDKEFLAPGELSSPHAQILSRHSTENRCAACHELQPTESVVAFLTKSWSGHIIDRQQQSLKCLECHQQTMPQAEGFSPHDLPQTVLADLTDKITSPTQFTSFASSLPKQELSRNDLACSTCHVEHQGRWHDLTQLSNERCQSCHQNRFAGFANGHPDFTDYPAHREARIHFNHQSHASKHFATKGTAFDCRSCHVDESQPSAVGPVGRSVSYEKACASCHDASLRSSFSDGILVIHLPSLDREKIEAAGLTLGNWPAEASLMTDGTLSPMLRWLLAGTADGQSLLARLPADGKISDLSTSDPSSLQLQVELATAIRTLIEELANAGQPALQKRFIASLRLAPSNAPELDPTHSTDAQRAEAWSSLFSGVSPDVFRIAWYKWFQPGQETMASVTFPSSPVASISFGTPDPAPGINQDRSDPLLEDPLIETGSDAKFEDGNRQKNKVQTFPDMSPQVHLPHGGWMVDERRLAIVYVPVGHSDPTVKAWLTAASSPLQADKPRHFHDLLQPKAMGACTECHQLGEAAGHSNAAERLWQAQESDPALRPFTRFNHIPHLTLPQLSQCTSCHVMQESGHFKPLQLQSCMDCHSKQGAGEHCSQCHNYHIKLRP